MEIKELSELLEIRPEQIRQERKRGTKVIAFFPGNYVPEEILFAAGTVPICLTHGGQGDAVQASRDLVPDIICPFARAQVGELVLQTNPFYKEIDMLIAPVTCQHLKKTADIWEYRTDMEIFKLGVPPQYDTDFGMDYFVGRLKTMMERVASVSGNRLTDEKLVEAIALYNRMRALFRSISRLRKNNPPIVSFSDFLFLNHLSFYLDPAVMVAALEKIQHRFERLTQSAESSDKPRILLIGPNVAFGDNTISKLVESVNAEIVTEEVCEGIRSYWTDVNTEGDPVRALAEGYLKNKLPCAFMRKSADRRLDFVDRLIDEFSISGVLWYELLGCETYDAESYFFAKKMEEREMPMLVVESDYGPSALQQLVVRMEAFVEQIRGV